MGYGTDEHIIIRTDMPEVTAQLEEYANYYYTPVTMPAIDGSGSINASSILAADVYTLYDDLVTAHTDYSITKTSLGNDHSGTLPIYKYVFTPKQYEKTLILGANMHGHSSDGDPKDGAIALYLFMKSLCEDWESDDKLSFLRWNCRLVVLPVQNPWGFNNNKRQNVTGVDINRNFSYGWSAYTPSENFAFGHDYKGTSAFSEKESQYIRDTLLLYSDAAAYLDFHSWANVSIPFKYVNSSSSFSRLNNVADDISKYLVTKYNTTRTLETTYDPMPNGFNYAEKVCNIPGCNPEFTVFTSDFPQRGSLQVTKMVEWYGNFIYLCAIKSITRTPRKASLLQSSASMAIANTNTVLKSFTEQFTSNTFAFDGSTGEFTIPSGVDYIRIAAQVFCQFNSASAETMQIAMFIQKNGGRLAGYPNNKNIVTLGGASTDLKEYCPNVSSPLIKVVAGEKYRLVLFTSHTGGLLSTYSGNLEATWFAIEEVKI